MRARMEEMQLQIQDFVKYIQEEVLTWAHAAADPSKGAILPVRRHLYTVANPERKNKPSLSYCLRLGEAILDL